MGGGLIQLVSLGSQDEYLIGNPQITFFKTVYRRHTNFAIETIEQTINGKKDTDKTETVGVVNVSRVGDLLINTYNKIIENIRKPGSKYNKIPIKEPQRQAYWDQGGNYWNQKKTEKGKYYISIADQGSGIKTEYSEKIFERFYGGRRKQNGVKKGDMD